MSSTPRTGTGRGRSPLALVVLALALACVAARPVPVSDDDGIWISRGELARLPAEGPAWERLLELASEDASPNVRDQDDRADVVTLAKALVHARTGEERFAEEVREACMAAIDTERDGRVLALGRNLVGYVIAADLVGLPRDADRRFREWLERARERKLEGRTLVSIHERRPNNWGTHAGASRAAIAVYLDDDRELRRCAEVFRGWCGERDAYDGFRFGELDWQADSRRPVAVNPVGATRDGHSIDGVLPDDQRRGGGFTWPPPKENYVYEALQGALVQAVILERAGYEPWEWGDRALLRAFEWLHEQAEYPAEGDDRWQSHLVNRVYDAEFPAVTPTSPGKNVGFTDWTHAPPPRRGDGTGHERGSG